MFPFWDLVIAPTLVAVKPKRVVEIGALRGETTELMLDHLGPGIELHVIDPLPEFDPAEHERKFPGRYIFHRDISHNVLPDLPVVEVALIDGDHNWYTVYHELKMIAATARAAGAPLPVLIMHDVGWPYGRRDLYYAPERIPEEFRQPYAQRGMGRQRVDLLPASRGGLNAEMNNAIREGGPRNGVMTALDDFEQEYDRPLRRLETPIFYGLAVVAEQEYLATNPELVRVLDSLESDDGLRELLDLGERLRIRAMLFQHSEIAKADQRTERVVDRYLDTLKGALLDEHYIENEVRIGYLVDCLETGRGLEEQKLRDPRRFIKEDMRRLQAERRSGQIPGRDGDRRVYFPYTAMGRVRLDHLHRALDELRAGGVKGDLVECGTGRVGGGVFMRGYLAAHELDDRAVWIADPFRASPEAAGEPVVQRRRPDGGRDLPFGGAGFPDVLADLNVVRDAFDRFDLFDERVRFLQGSPRDTLPTAPIEKIALLRIGASASPDVDVILQALYDRLSIGGRVVIEDGSSCAGAVESFRSGFGIADPVERVDDVGITWPKTAEAGSAPIERPAPSATPARSPLSRPQPSDRCDLSVVAVFYNMRREATRTLHSVSRAYQRGIEDLDYEVIVVDNGSSPDERLTEEFVQSFGSEFHLVDLADVATPSPVPALNRGIEDARGDVFALMIDGAHVVTPGVLRFGMTGITSYPTALVVAQQWYIGPGQQPDMLLQGYGQDYEDRLFEEIEWPTDGYRLFDIGHFIGDRDWFDGLWESNCIFTPRKLLEQVGGLDENFAMPGGGAANLDLYERLASSPDVSVVTILGEGSFHQLHGGDTTNQAEPAERKRRVTSYLNHYSELRRKQFRGHGKPIHYVGSMQSAAFRTKARRRTPKAFLAAAKQDDGIPEQPVPIPEDFVFDFIDAFWHNLAWRDVTWLGTSLPKAPTDLIAYQEMVSRVRPDWIIEFPSANGGRALFFATICELLDHGQVVSVDPGDDPDRPRHPRITYVRGRPSEKAIIAEVRKLTGDVPHGLVVVGSVAPRQQISKEIASYERFVSVGSYLVVEETMVNGHPVRPEFGPGPWEAVKQLNRRSDFVADPSLERFALTFNPGGFLKRVR
jgi:cephalosporin hydroxylase